MELMNWTASILVVGFITAGIILDIRQRRG